MRRKYPASTKPLKPSRKGRKRPQRGGNHAPCKPLPVSVLGDIRDRLEEIGDLRDQAVFMVAIDSMLRISDIVRLKKTDITGYYGEILPRVTIRMKKTRNKTTFLLSEATQAVLKEYMTTRAVMRSPSFIFPGRTGPHITEAALRLRVKTWLSWAGLRGPGYSCHSLRKTKAAEVYRQTKDLAIVAKLLGHTSPESAARYLGIGLDEALEAASEIEMF